jgi:hypothetical protein
MKRLSPFFAALAVAALTASVALAQEGTLRIVVDCGDPESVTVVNQTDATLVLEGVSSSQDRVGNPEARFDVEVPSGRSVVRAIGGGGGGAGNIFEDGAEEVATVFVSGEAYDEAIDVSCGAEDLGTRELQLRVANMPPVTPSGETSTPETPTGLGQMGAGGLATSGARLPWGAAAAGLSFIGAAGYAVVRCRRP